MISPASYINLHIFLPASYTGEALKSTIYKSQRMSNTQKASPPPKINIPTSSTPTACHPAIPQSHASQTQSHPSYLQEPLLIQASKSHNPKPIIPQAHLKTPISNPHPFIPGYLSTTTKLPVDCVRDIGTTGGGRYSRSHLIQGRRAF